MFSLRHLVCCGCDVKNVEHIFLDDDKKRPLFTKCGHTLCSECQESFPNCPVCKEEVQPIENFAARNIFEEFRKNPVLVFKNWFNSEITKRESCSRCHEGSEKLSLCITCGLESKTIHPEILRIKRELTRREKILETSEMSEMSGRKKSLSCLSGLHGPTYNVRAHKSGPVILAAKNRVQIPWHYYEEKTVYRTNSFNLLACQVLCSDCVLDHHQGHKRKTLLELTYSTMSLKEESSWMATKFLRDELKKIDGKCLITKMRIQRTCEKLCHLVKMYYPKLKVVEPKRNRHDRIPSEVNKFFESIGKMDSDILPLEQCNSWIHALEQNLEQLKNQKLCNCQAVWDEMHKLSFGNQVEEYFVKIINDLGDKEIFECPLQIEEFAELRNKAVEMSKTNIFKIYTAFCWDKKQNRVCGLFDNLNRKPIVCRNCGASTCSKCLRSYCSSCGYQQPKEKLEGDSDLLELVAVYKNNCVNILEEWWSCEASQLQYCMSCSSYSDQLEMCVRCERIQKNNAVNTKRNAPYAPDIPLLFKYSGLETFPIRWQCSSCRNRLQADFAHQFCDTSTKDDWIFTWTRGCNHLLTRIHPTKKCIGNDSETTKCEYNALCLKHIKNYEIAMKVATSKMVFSILKAGIEEKVKCRLKRIQFLKIYGELRTQTRYYLRGMLAGKNLDEASSRLFELVEMLKTKWNNHRETECFCEKFWENASKLTKMKVKEFLRTQENKDHEVCPLELFLDTASCESSEACQIDESSSYNFSFLHENKK
ncbi:unnamed protein product [Caenorhabditis brenneri]